MRPWYARNVGDIMKDTQHLSCEEFGAYNRLLDIYYATRKPIENNPAIIRKYFGESLQKTKKIMKVLSIFFDEKNGFLYHKRVELELEKSDEIHRVKSEAGKKSWENRHAGAVASDNQQPQTHKERVSSTTQQGAIPSDEQEVVDLYNDILTELIPIGKLTPELREQIRTIQNDPDIGCPTIEHWVCFFKRVKSSDYLTGRTRGKPSRYSLRGLLKIETYAKIYEGQYD